MIATASCWFWKFVHSGAHFWITFIRLLGTLFYSFGHTHSHWNCFGLIKRQKSSYTKMPYSNSMNAFRYQQKKENAKWCIGVRSVSSLGCSIQLGVFSSKNSAHNGPISHFSTMENDAYFHIYWYGFILYYCSFVISFEINLCCFVTHFIAWIFHGYASLLIYIKKKYKRWWRWDNIS